MHCQGVRASENIPTECDGEEADFALSCRRVGFRTFVKHLSSGTSLYKSTQNRKRESGIPRSTKIVIWNTGDTHSAFHCIPCNYEAGFQLSRVESTLWRQEGLTRLIQLWSLMAQEYIWCIGIRTQGAGYTWGKLLRRNPGAWNREVGYICSVWDKVFAWPIGFYSVSRFSNQWRYY